MLAEAQREGPSGTQVLFFPLNLSVGQVRSLPLGGERCEGEERTRSITLMEFLPQVAEKKLLKIVKRKYKRHGGWTQKMWQLTRMLK